MWRSNRGGTGGSESSYTGGEWNLALHVAERLNRAGLRMEIGRFTIYSEPGDILGDDGYWNLEGDDWTPEWTKRLWERLEVIAECLLATPMATGEQPSPGSRPRHDRWRTVRDQAQHVDGVKVMTTANGGPDDGADRSLRKG